MVVKRFTKCSRWAVIVLCAVSAFRPAVVRGDDRAVPAQLIYQMSLPGKGDHFLRPGRIAVDRGQNEIYIADQGNARIVILDQNGVFKFGFSVAEQCGTPLDIAVNSRGEILVLGSGRGGRGVFVFDFDGLYTRMISPAEDAAAGEIISLAVDDRDRVYLLSAGGTVSRYGSDGGREVSFRVGPDADSTSGGEIFFGSLSITDGGEIYVPASSVGTVYRYDVDGRLQGTIGHPGTDMGELSFPVAAVTTEDGLILVLDKHRYTVICFRRDGKFLGEFGGKGIHAGWFYHPTWLAIDDSDRVYVGQIFGNRIQVCRVPEFVRAQISATAGGRSVSSPASAPAPIDLPAAEYVFSHFDNSGELDISTLCLRRNSWGLPTTSSHSPHPLRRFFHA
jgi:hypothetical protein